MIDNIEIDPRINTDEANVCKTFAKYYCKHNAVNHLMGDGVKN